MSSPFHYLKVKFGEDVWHDESYNGFMVDFFDRRESKEQIMAIIRSPETRRAVWIIGERRAGKTSMLRLILEKCKREDFLAFEVPWQTIHSAKSFYQEFLYHLNTVINTKIDLSSVDSSSSFWDSFYMCQQKIGQRTIIVGVDEIDSIFIEQVDENSRKEILGCILRLVTYEQNIKIILTSAKHSSQIERLKASSLISKSQEIRLLPFSNVDLEEMISSLAPSLLDKEREYIKYMSGGWPYYAKAILYHLLQLPPADPRRLDKAQFAAIESIKPTCEHLYRHHWNDDERRVLLLLTNKGQIHSEEFNKLHTSLRVALRELIERGYVIERDGRFHFRVVLLAIWFNIWTPRRLREEELEIPLLLKNVSNLSIEKPVDQFIQNEDRRTLRNWWHRVLRDYDKYLSYAMFLLLPSDEDAIQYLIKYDTELGLISGKDCLVLIVSKSDFVDIYSKEENRQLVIKEYVVDGYSISIARLFGIDLEIFPCLVIFQDIRSSEHIVISLKGMAVSEIASKMRAIFSIIHNAINERQNPLQRLERERKSEKFRVVGQTIVGEIQNIAGKTIETAIETLVQGQLK